MNKNSTLSLINAYRKGEINKAELRPALMHLSNPITHEAIDTLIDLADELKAWDEEFPPDR